MIVREHGAQLLILSEPDLAGTATAIARHFGNDRFNSPDEAVLRAIARLGAGFAEHDDMVRPGPDGRPVDREQLGLTELLAAGTRATEPGETNDPEALLLTSIVAMQLAADAANSRPGQPTPLSVGQLRLLFETNKFVHAQIELQESLRQQLGLATDRPLRLGIAETLDDPAEFALSMQVRLLHCLRQMAERLARGSSGVTASVLVAETGEFEPIRLRSMSPDRWLVLPWSFDSDRLTIELPFRAWSPGEPTGVRYASLPLLSRRTHLCSRP